MQRKHSSGRFAGLAPVLVAAFLLQSCKTMESYLPELIAIGGTVLEVASLSYKQGQYAQQVSLLMATFTPAATSMAQTWAANRKKASELARLQALESEIEAEYAALEQQSAAAAPAQGNASGWTTANPSSAGTGWTNVAPTPGDSASENPWGTAYRGKGVIPKSLEGGPLELDVALLKRVGERAEAIENGAVLHDAGSAPGGSGDELRAYFSPSGDAYVYVIAVDARARVQPLFPAELPPRGTVPAGAQVLLPDGESWYGLDQDRGLQHVYFYASRTRQPKLEALMHRFASQPRPEPEGKQYAVSTPTVVESETAVAARGLTGVAAQRIVKLPAPGGSYEVQATSASAEAEDAPVLVTRHFDHQ